MTAMEERRKQFLALLPSEMQCLYLRGDVANQSRHTTDVDLLDPVTGAIQESFFFYVSGIPLESGLFNDAQLIVRLNESVYEFILYVHEAHPDDIVWHGSPLDWKSVKKQYLLTDIRYSDQLVNDLKQWNYKNIFTLPENTLGKNYSENLMNQGFNIDQQRLLPILISSRLIKTPAEVKLIQEANAITDQAHLAWMRHVRKEKSATEMTCDAVFRFTCHSLGGPVQAYPPIVAYHENAAILHYNKNSQTCAVQEGGWMLVDAGCSIQHYCADVTRCVPVNGRFSVLQKQLYESVLDVQNTAIASIQPGILYETLHFAAVEQLGRHLFGLGLIQGDWESIEKHHVPALFMPHGLGHLLGLDVHDVGGYPAGVARFTEPGARYLRLRQKLVAGMVVTIEPGCYFISSLLEPAYQDPNIAPLLNRSVIEKYANACPGIRIEDNVLVTEQGFQVLTKVPKTVLELEQWMNSE